jgi:hypothetical protein
MKREKSNKFVFVCHTDSEFRNSRYLRVAIAIYRDLYEKKSKINIFFNFVQRIC